MASSRPVRGFYHGQLTGFSADIWRKRVGVEPTILAAKDRINGFEGHEGHRTPFASDACRFVRLRVLLNVRNSARLRDWLRCYCSVGWICNSGHGLALLTSCHFGDAEERFFDCASRPGDR